MASKSNSLVHSLFSFDGRMRRSRYWVTNIGLNVAVAGLGALATLMFGGEGSIGSDLANGAVGLIFLWPTMAVVVKRGHDRNYPAFRSIATVLFVVVCAAFGGGGADSALFPGAPYWVALGLLVCTSLYLIVDYGFIDGTPGANRYGQSPKGEGTTIVAETFD